MKVQSENIFVNYGTCQDQGEISCGLPGTKKTKSNKLFGAYRYCYLAISIGICISFGISAILDANYQAKNALQNDRPCNSLLDYNDAHLSTPEIISKYGYPAEQHWVTTEDGYILEIHRIPQLQRKHSKSFSNHSQGNDKQILPRPAVFLIHGVVSSSRDFVINCDRRALAFQLWENGYDVWMGNYRGNVYSLNHTHLKTDKLEFWDFSIDEIGYYDFPAMIDYVLNHTSLKKVSIVGHSMGNAVTLIMLSKRPEYNKKINIWFGMAACSTLKNTDSPALRFFPPFSKISKWFLTTFNHGELFHPSMRKLLNYLWPLLCRFEGSWEGSYHGICAGITYIMDGYFPGQVSPKLYSVIFGGIPTSTSIKFVDQWMQWIANGTLAKYDLGPSRNLKEYGHPDPIPFEIGKVTTQTIIMYGENDRIVTAKDVQRMKALTDSLNYKSDRVQYLKIKSPQWNHFSFLYGKDADIYVYNHILRRLKMVYQNQNQSIPMLCQNCISSLNSEKELNASGPLSRIPNVLLPAQHHYSLLGE